MTKTGINWTPTGAQAQSLIVYLESLGIDATTAVNVRTMLKRITDYYGDSVNTHLLAYGHIDSYESAGNQGYIPDFNLLEAFSGLTRLIVDICVGTWNDAAADPGACTTTATIDTWLAANRPELPAALVTVLHTVVATDINTNLLPADVVDPADDTKIGNDAGSNFNIYKGAVGTLLRRIAQWLRAYCGPTLESNSNSSSNGSYIEGLDIVVPIPRNVGLTGAKGA